MPPKKVNVKTWKWKKKWKNESFQKMQKSEKAWSKTIENKREKGQNHNYKDHSEYEKPALKPVFGFVSSGLL